MAESKGNDSLQSHHVGELCLVLGFKHAFYLGKVNLVF